MSRRDLPQERKLRRSACTILAAFGVLLAGGRAAASPVAFTATLSIELFVDGGDEPASLAAGTIALGGAGIAEVSGAAFTLPAGSIGGSFATEPTLGPGAPIVSQQGALANLAGSFAASGGDVVGTMGMSGSWQWGLFGPPPFLFVELPIAPLGVGGSETHATPAGTYRMDGGTWTTGTASVSAAGIPDLFATGYDARNPAGIGTIAFVTPIHIDNETLPTAAEPAGFATLTLRFVPEPGTAILLGVGLAALAMRARSRRISSTRTTSAARMRA